MKNFILVILIYFLSTSCSDVGKTQTLEGMWAIQSIRYGNMELNNTYYGNLITFHNDGSCELPLNRYGQLSDDGSWKQSLDKKGKIISIKIISEDSIFNNLFLTTNKMFFDPEDGSNLILAGLTMKSQNVEIVLQGRLTGFY